ncbi:MAG: FAD:protein FMN transferase [Thermodesulfobacteriota bacterium]
MPVHKFSHSMIRPALIAVLIACAIGGIGYGLYMGKTGQKSALSGDSPTATRPLELEQVRSGWWETRRSIYYEIPARIRFALPEGKQSAKKIAASGWAAFENIGRIFNPYAPETETARLNDAHTTGPIPVSEKMHALLTLCKRLWQTSEGAFDPTMLPVKRLWKNAVNAQQIPSDRDILRTMDRVGFEKVSLRPQKRAIEFQQAGIRFDFGGVAKGYAVDHVVTVLKAQGVKAGLVQLGGEIAAFGKNADPPWRIGVQHPLRTNSVWGVVAAEKPLRVSTSGNYRQPLIIDGHRFYHIFSPKTGKPVSEKVLGVTTVSFGADRSSAFLDGAATAITVLGADEGLALAKKSGIDTLILKRSANGEITETMTAGFKTHYRPSAAR